MQGFTFPFYVFSLRSRHLSYRFNVQQAVMSHTALWDCCRPLPSTAGMCDNSHLWGKWIVGSSCLLVHHELIQLNSHQILFVNSASQETPHLFWNPKVHKSLLLVPVLSQMNPVLAFPPLFSEIRSNVIHGLIHGLFPSGFPTKILY
jgi:hypothetical protein